MQLHPTRSGAHLAIASIAVVAVGVVASEAALVGWGGAVLVGVAIARAATLVSVARIRAAGFEMLWTGTQRVARTHRGSTVELEAEVRNRDTLGARYALRNWTFNLSTTHQSSQYSDLANTVAESADGSVGRIPGFRLWNIQAMFKVPQHKNSEISIGLNNLFDKRFYTRNVDGNAGRMVGAPRMVYVQARLGF